jgi:Mrp family chromosome partitioning ATPase
MSQLPGQLTDDVLIPSAGQLWKTDPMTHGASASSNGFRKIELTPDENSRMVFQTDPNGIAIEQYRLLRHNLTEQFPQGGILMITSPAKGDGKTLNAINLAWCLAESNSPTLLAEFDLRQPAIGSSLGIRPSPGVESALSGEVSPESVVLSVNGLPLYIAAAAKAVRHPLAVFKSPATTEFLAWARKKFRWVVMDAPPVIASADVPELAPMSDAVLMVLRVHSTPRELVQKSYQLVGQRLRGVILNEANLCWDSYYRYMSAYQPLDR